MKQRIRITIELDTKQHRTVINEWAHDVTRGYNFTGELVYLATEVVERERNILKDET